ncbi:MAG: peptidase S41, partial [Deltaproteobacteria bacterium]|nr:peptidase S41 [Candidatus Tharpellaceae bacterium]
HQLKEKDLKGHFENHDKQKSDDKADGKTTGDESSLKKPLEKTTKPQVDQVEKQDLQLQRAVELLQGWQVFKQFQGQN